MHRFKYSRAEADDAKRLKRVFLLASASCRSYSRHTLQPAEPTHRIECAWTPSLPARTRHDSGSPSLGVQSKKPRGASMFATRNPYLPFGRVLSCSVRVQICAAGPGKFCAVSRILFSDGSSRVPRCGEALSGPWWERFSFLTTTRKSCRCGIVFSPGAVLHVQLSVEKPSFSG